MVCMWRWLQWQRWLGSFQSGGDVQSDLQTRFAGNGANCERRLPEAALTRCAGDLRPPGSDAMKVFEIADG